MGEQSPQLPKRRLLTWHRVWITLAVLLLLLLTAIGRIAGHLETPWLRQKVIAAVRSSQHLDIDYRQASVGLDGLELRDLSLASLPEDRDLAPELLHVAHVTAKWAWRDLLPGHEKRVAVDVTGVALNVVLDAHGETSLQRLLAVLPPSPPKPLSQLFAGLKDAPAVKLEPLQIAGIQMRLVRRNLGGAHSHAFLGDLTLNGEIATGPKARLDVMLGGDHLQLETTDWPLDLPQPATDVLAWLAPLQSGTGVLPLTLTTRVTLADDRLKVSTCLDRAENRQLLGLQLELAPDPKRHGLTLVLKEFALLGMAKADATLFWTRYLKCWVKKALLFFRFLILRAREI